MLQRDSLRWRKNRKFNSIQFNSLIHLIEIEFIIFFCFIEISQNINHVSLLFVCFYVFTVTADIIHHFIRRCYHHVWYDSCNYLLYSHKINHPHRWHFYQFFFSSFIVSTPFNSGLYKLMVRWWLLLFSTLAFPFSNPAMNSFKSLKCTSKDAYYSRFLFALSWSSWYPKSEMN